eukprot:4286894-Amphidinium_carterae.2
MPSTLPSNLTGHSGPRHASASCRSEIHPAVSNRLQEVWTWPHSNTMCHPSASDPQISEIDEIYHKTNYGESLYASPHQCSASYNDPPDFISNSESTTFNNTTALRAATFNALSLSDDRGLASTGQITRLAQLMQTHHLDILTVQETRLNITEPINLSSHHAIHTPATRGKGGLLTLVTKLPTTKILLVHAPHPRLLFVKILMDGTIVHIGNCHAPIRDAPSARHQEFFEHFVEATKSIQDNHYLLIGVDMNARLGALHEDFGTIIGPYTTPIKGRSHILELLCHCQHRHFHFTNTIIPPTNSTLQRIPPRHSTVHDAIVTWKKASKCPFDSTHQIDFVITNWLTFTATSKSEPLPWHLLTTLHESDHRAVTIHFVIKHGASHTHTPKRLHRQFVNEEHRQQFRAALSSVVPRYHQDFPADTTPPHIQLAHLQQLVQRCVECSAPKHLLTPKKCWITDTTLMSLTQLTRLRRLKALWQLHSPPRREFAPSASVVTQIQALDEFSLIDWRQVTTTNLAIIAQVKALVKISRRQLRADKQAWLSETCDRIDASLRDTHTWEAYRDIRKITRTGRARPPQRLQKPDGSLTCAMDEIDKIWRDHWLSHFNGHISTSNSFHHHAPPQFHSCPLSP